MLVDQSRQLQPQFSTLVIMQTSDTQQRFKSKVSCFFGPHSLKAYKHQPLFRTAELSAVRTIVVHPALTLPYDVHAVELKPPHR